MDKTPLLTLMKLYKFLTVSKTVKREILVELDVHHLIENLVALE